MEHQWRQSTAKILTPKKYLEIDQWIEDENLIRIAQRIVKDEQLNALEIMFQEKVFKEGSHAQKAEIIRTLFKNINVIGSIRNIIELSQKDLI